MSKKQQPFLPMFVGDFMAATAEWEGEEQSLYALLLMHQWALGHLPAEIPKLARLVKYDQHNFERWWPTVSTKFEARSIAGFGARLVNPRLEQHRAKTLALSEKNSHSGKKGADAKWRNDGERHPESVASATETDGERHQSANGVTYGNPSHPIPSHPDPDPPSRSAQVPSVTSTSRARVLAGDPREVFERIRERYPQGLHRGDHWTLAERAVYRLLDEGVTDTELVAAVDAYAAQQLALQNTGTERVLRPQNFFAENRWRGPFPVPKTAAVKRMRTAREIADSYPENAA